MCLVDSEVGEVVMKTGSDVRGWSEMVGEVPMCLAVQAVVGCR